jgi:hypothetical protein
MPKLIIRLSTDAVERAGFDTMITADKNIPFQQTARNVPLIDRNQGFGRWSVVGEGGRRPVRWALGRRWSAGRKRVVVLHLLRGSVSELHAGRGLLSSVIISPSSTG